MKNNFPDFSEVLKVAIEFGGKEILKDKRKTNNYLEDLDPENKFQKEKKLLSDAYSCNAVNILLDADTSPDRHKKAVESAKSKLMGSMALSESGSDLILKEICNALGWNTQQLFSSSSSQKKVQSAIPKGNKNVSSNKENYNQLITNIEPVNTNKPYSEKASVAANARASKKKSPWGTVLKAAAVIIAVCSVCFIYNLRKNDGNGDTGTIDETQTTSGTTIPVNLGKNDGNGDTGIIDETQTIPETTVPVTTQEVATADPRAGKYVITDIARFECESFYYDRFMAYASNENVIYYVTGTGDVHRYNLSDQSDTIVITLSEIIEKTEKTNENSLSNKTSDFSKFKIDGVVFNQYSGKSYVLAYNPYSSLYLYDINEDSFIKFKSSTSQIYGLSFINKDEFLEEGSDWTLYNIANGNEKRAGSGYSFYRIVDINDNYYVVRKNQGEVRKCSNVYSAESEKLFSLKFTGADEKDNTLYYKDEKNNVFKIDLDNLTEEIYISVDDIFQNGKQFLGSGKCSGLYMTNDGGFITYDKSDNRLKYVTIY